MLFSLPSKNVVREVDDRCLDLSVFLSKLCETSGLFVLLNQVLEKSAYSKQTCEYVINSLKKQNVWTLQDLETKDLEWPSTVMMYCVKNGLPEIREESTHVIKFVKDEIMELVLEFLQIPCSVRGVDMFQKVVDQAQGQMSARKSFGDFFPAEFKEYVEFVDRQSDETIVKLVEAAGFLDIAPLSQLLALRVAHIITTTSPEELRRRFHLPESLRDPTREELYRLMKEKPWMKTCESKKQE